MTDPAPADRGTARPFAMSWLDIVNEWVARLPGPAWLAYVVATAVSAGVFVGLQVSQAGGSAGSEVFLAFFAAQPVIVLAFAHAVREAAGRSLATFRPLLPEEADFGAIAHRLLNAPAREVMLVSLIAGVAVPPAMLGVVGAGADVQLRALGFAPGAISLVLTWFFAAVLAAAIGGFFVHLVHQLREIARLLGDVPSLDLYRLEPVYAFSSTTALAAILLTVDNYAWYAVQPALLADPFSLAMGALAGALALGAFALPLWGAHRLLVKEKAMALAENGAAFQSLARRLRAQIASDDLGDVERVSKAMAILEQERTSLARVPTWPWHAETLRTILATVFLPIAVWLGQFILRRVLGD